MASAPSQRSAEVSRKTKETVISVAVDIDGTGRFEIATGVGFFDHMLDQLSRHSLIDMTVKAKGDLHIDDHHTVEDTGIALGQAIAKALGERRGITRYASLDLAMDETLTKAAIDVSGRPFLVWNVAFSSPKIGTFDTELVREFFQALAQHAGITLHVTNLYGANNHHIAETCFKAVARVLRTALERDPRQAGRGTVDQGLAEGVGHGVYVVMDRRQRATQAMQRPSSATASRGSPFWCRRCGCLAPAVDRGSTGDRGARHCGRTRRSARPRIGRLLLSLLVSSIVGLEGNALRIAALRRRGWQRMGRGRGRQSGRCRCALRRWNWSPKRAADQRPCSPPSANRPGPRRRRADRPGLLNPGR